MTEAMELAVCVGGGRLTDGRLTEGKVTEVTVVETLSALPLLVSVSVEADWRS